MTSVFATNKMERQGYSSGTTAKLAIESKRMEDRLRMLKQMMSAEKSRREAEGGLHWQSGAHHQEKRVVKHSGRSNKKPLRVKLLTDGGSLASRLPQCGQCEKATATLCCVECAEKYCQLCFAKFHQKGALSMHHAKPLLNMKTTQSCKIKLKCGVSIEMSSSTASSIPRDRQTTISSTGQSAVHTAGGDGRSLLEGTYNEEESAATFQQALAEWRGGGNITNTSDNENSSVISSNTTTATQAGTGMTNRAREEGKVKSEDIGVHFSNKNGVSYFEKLVMRRHRYDPLYLAKSVTSDNVTNSPTHITDEESFDANDRGDSETTPSQYNIFFCSDEDEPSHCDEQQYDSLVDLYRPQSSVQIKEETYLQVQTLVEARPQAVTMQLGDIKHIAEPVSEGVVRDVTADHRVRPSKQTSARKKSAKPSTSLSSASGKRGHSSKMKTTPSNRDLPQSSDDSSRMKSPGTTITRSQDINSNIEAAVKSAWSDRSKQSQLSHFFLQAVDPSLPEMSSIHLTDQVDNDCEGTSREFQLAASVWLPGNSTVDPLSDINSHSLNVNETEPTYTTMAGINVFTDLPSSSVHQDGLQLHVSNSTITDDVDSDSECEDDQQTSRATLVCDLEEQEEWNQEDHDTLESLSWELASTVECEGRLTRCESELEDSIEYRMGTPLFVGDTNDDIKEGALTDVDMHQMMSDFELYQKQVMEYDSN